MIETQRVDARKMSDEALERTIRALEQDDDVALARAYKAYRAKRERYFMDLLELRNVGMRLRESGVEIPPDGEL